MPSKNTLRNLRRQAAQEQGSRCFYCQLPMWDAGPEELIGRMIVSPRLAKRFKCTAEHIEARCDGGRDVASNIVAACFHCNSTRHKAKRPVAAATYALKVRSRMEKGRWHPLKVKMAPSFS